MQYASREMRDLWSAGTMVMLWHNIELVVLAAQAERGLIPSEWAERAAEAPIPSQIDWEAATMEAGHEVVGYLRASGLDHVHIGLTSSDLTDTALALRVNASTALIHQAAKAAIQVCRGLAALHEDTQMLGRTHGQAAVPDTFGRRLTVLGDQMQRCLDRFERLPGKISGPVGSHRHEVVGPELEFEALDAMQLSCEHGDPEHQPACTQIVPRDYLARWAVDCSLLTSAGAAVGLEVRLLAQHGIQEVREGRGPAYAGSSAMPHKSNPSQSERLAGLARMARSMALAISEGIEQWGYRDLSHSSVEREFVPTLAGVTEVAMATVEVVLSDLQVDTDRMAQNLADAWEQATSHDRMTRHQLDGMSYSDAARAATTKEG